MKIQIEHKPEVRKMYEVTFIVVPELNDSEYKKVAEKFEKLIKKHGGEIINIEHWGQQKLAYPIKRRGSGYYCYMEYFGDPDSIGKVEQEFIYDVQVIRYLTVRVDKFHQEYNKKRRDGSFNVDKKAEDKN